MKKQTKHITGDSKSEGTDQLTFHFGGISITLRTVDKLQVKLPMPTTALQEVVVNGEVFTRPGRDSQIVRVAPVKYSDAQFREVNSLVEHRHYSKEAAIRDVADARGHDFGNFRRQYYERKGSLMGVDEEK